VEYNLKRKSKKNSKRAIVKDISLTAAILTLIFMALVAVYQLTAGQHDLADDLAVTFSSYKK
jgi:hypothetical protein